MGGAGGVEKRVCICTDRLGSGLACFVFAAAWKGSSQRIDHGVIGFFFWLFSKRNCYIGFVIHVSCSGGCAWTGDVIVHGGVGELFQLLHQLECFSICRCFTPDSSSC